MLDIREIEYWISRYENETTKLDDCVVWAALLLIRDNLNVVKPMQQYKMSDLSTPQQLSISTYSEAAAPVSETLGRYGDSNFLRVVEGLDPAAAWSVMDEHMNTLRVVNPRVYDGVMRKLGGI